VKEGAAANEGQANLHPPRGIHTCLPFTLLTSGDNPHKWTAGCRLKNTFVPAWFGTEHQDFFPRNGYRNTAAAFCHRWTTTR